MNTLRQFSYRAVRSTVKTQPQRLTTTTFHHRFIQRGSSPFLRQRKVNLLIKNPRPTFLSRRRFSSVFGASVIGAFIKTSLVFYAIPITAAASPYFNTLPVDFIYGLILPYHAYVGMAHILTGYSSPYYYIIIANSQNY